MGNNDTIVIDLAGRIRDRLGRDRLRIALDPLPFSLANQYRGSGKATRRFLVFRCTLYAENARVVHRAGGAVCSTDVFVRTSGLLLTFGKWSCA